jgi:hypothetical protein
LFRCSKTRGKQFGINIEKHHDVSGWHPVQRCFGADDNPHRIRYWAGICREFRHRTHRQRLDLFGRSCDTHTNVFECGTPAAGTENRADKRAALAAKLSLAAFRFVKYKRAIASFATSNIRTSHTNRKRRTTLSVQYTYDRVITPKNVSQSFAQQALATWLRLAPIHQLDQRPIRSFERA